MTNVVLVMSDALLQVAYTSHIIILIYSSRSVRERTGNVYTLCQSPVPSVRFSSSLSLFTWCFIWMLRIPVHPVSSIWAQDCKVCVCLFTSHLLLIPLEPTWVDTVNSTGANGANVAEPTNTDEHWNRQTFGTNMHDVIEKSIEMHI